MVNFHQVKIPGVDFDLEPVPIPMEVFEVKEIDDEARPQEEGPPQDDEPPQEDGPSNEYGPPHENGPPQENEAPQENEPPQEDGPPEERLPLSEPNSENPPDPPNPVSGDRPFVDHSPDNPPRMREYSQENLPPSEETPLQPPSGTIPIEIDHHHHYSHDSSDEGPEGEPQTPINTSEENLKLNENIPDMNNNKMIENDERERSRLPPPIHSSYEDSQNLLDNHQNNGHNDDSHSGTLPHSHPIDQNKDNQKGNIEYHHNEHNHDEHHPHDDEQPPEGPPPQSNSHLNEDPNHYHSRDHPINGPNDGQQQPEVHDIQNPNIEPKTYFVPKPEYFPNRAKKERKTVAEHPDHRQIDFNQIPSLKASDPNINPEHKHQSVNQQNQQERPVTLAEVGLGRGDQIMKYYEDQSKVDSKRYAQLATFDSKRNKTGLKLVKRNSNRFRNYKNTNGPQIIGENKQINKRIGLSSDSRPSNHERKGYYQPINYERPPQQYNNGPTIGSREYRKAQEYHSYEPNNPTNEEEVPEVPSDELKKFYDQWAEQHLKSVEDKYKTNDHLIHPKSSFSEEELNRDYNKDKHNEKHSQKNHPISAQDYESSRPTTQDRPYTTPKPYNSSPYPIPRHHHHDYQPDKHQHEDTDHDEHPPHTDDHDDDHNEEETEPDSEQEPGQDPGQEPGYEPGHESEHEPGQEPGQEQEPGHEPDSPINYQRYSSDQSKPHNSEEASVDEQEYPPQRKHFYREPQREGMSQKTNKNLNENNSKPKPDDNFQYDIPEMKEGTGNLDALTPQNISGIADNYQENDNQNGQEMNENENPEQSRSEDEPHQSSPRDKEDDQQEYESHRKRPRFQNSQHSPHKYHDSRHSQHSQHSQHSHPSQSYKNDKTLKNDYNNQNNDYSQKENHFRQPTNSRYRDPNNSPTANHRPNDDYYNHKNNERKTGQYPHRLEGEPHIRPYSGRQRHYDEEKAATADTSTQNVHPNTGILVSDESQKVLTQTHSSLNSNNENQTLTIKSIDSFSSWSNPLILKNRLIGVDSQPNGNHTKLFPINKTLEEEQEIVAQQIIETKIETNKQKRNITRKPKIETKIIEKNTINSVDISNKTQTYDMIINPNNKSEYQLKSNNPKTINQQLVRTVRTRPQRSIADFINFERNPHHLNDNQLPKNSLNSLGKTLPNILTHLRNRSSENLITQPKCIEKSVIKSFCVVLDEEYPLESIRRNLIRNLENLRSVHRRLNSSVTNDSYYKDSTDSLDNSCKTHKLTILPLRAKNINGEWKVIVNIGDLFEQRITLTNCSEEHKECQTNGQKYFTKCVQKYSLNDLITYNRESSDFEIDIFLVPNVCSCSPHKTNII